MISRHARLYSKVLPMSPNVCYPSIRSIHLPYNHNPLVVVTSRRRQNPKVERANLTCLAIGPMLYCRPLRDREMWGFASSQTQVLVFDADFSRCPIITGVLLLN